MKARPHFSVVVPYCNRLPYLERALRALSEQDVGLGDFEIVIACLEYSESLARVLAGLPLGLRVRCIMTREQWNTSRARNLAMAHAEGKVLLLLDADMLVPRSLLRNLRDRYDLANSDCLVAGQILNYSSTTTVTREDLAPYEYYRDTYLAQSRREGLGSDMRWRLREKPIPWSHCWTALMALPRHLIEKHSLYFDETFTGWGAEDLEWGYRLQNAGIPLVFADDLWGMHLPHLRCAGKNAAEQEHNYHRLLCKWPRFEVEMVTRFGDAANLLFNELAEAWQEVCGRGETVVSVEFSVAGSHRVVIGAAADASGELIDAGRIPGLAAGSIVRQLPLLGLRLPYADQSLDTAYLLGSLRTVQAGLYILIRTESARIAGQTVLL